MFLALALSTAFAQPQMQSFTVYDGDHRQEYFEIKDAAVRANADSAVALFDTHGIQITNGVGTINTQTLEASEQMCHEEKFSQEPGASFCSGSLIAPDRVLTAGHCVDESDPCESITIAFNYNASAADKWQTTFASEELYKCKKVIAREETISGLDYTVIQLDRPAIGHAPVKLAKQDVAAGDAIYLLSHPSGMPLKLSSSKGVKHIDGPRFTAEIDSFGGSSGGPIFSAKTNELVGILVAGESDFAWSNGCMISNNCTNGSCDGEHAVSILEIMESAAAAGN